MKILAFDTSATACSVALFDSDQQSDQQIQSTHQLCPMQHAKHILPMINTILRTSALTFSQLDAIAYSCGPGSFTGVRIASSVAQGIGFAATLPVIAISSLAVLAQTIYLEQQWANLLVCLDAYREQVYWAVYQINPEGCAQLVGTEQLGSPIEVIMQCNVKNYQEQWGGIGNGWTKYSTILTKQLGFQPLLINTTQVPFATAIIPLAIAKFKKKEWVAAEHAVPVYLD